MSNISTNSITALTSQRKINVDEMVTQTELAAEINTQITPLGTKLNGIAVGATKNATDAQLRDRSTHTGTQPLSSITGAGTAAAMDATDDLGFSQNKLMTQFGLARALAPYGAGSVSHFTWNRKTDTKISGTFQEQNSVQAKMKRCLLLDDGTVNYYTDPLDTTKKANGGVAILSGADGQVVVEIDRTWVKVQVQGDAVTWATSPVPVPGFVLHPAFLKGGELYFDEQLGFMYYKNPTEILEKVYYSAYGCNVQSAADPDTYIDGLNLEDNSDRVEITEDKLASVSGSFPMVGLTRAQMRQLATNRGEGWQLLDFWTTSLIQFLFVTEHHTLNTQAVLGAGQTAGAYADSSAIQELSPHTMSGKSNSIGNASGFLNGTSRVAWMSYRGIEHWYGNCLQSMDGVVFAARAVYVSNTPEEYGDTITNHALLGVTLPETGYIRQVAETSLSFMPTLAVGGGSSIAFSDYVYTGASTYVAWFGGYANTGANAGGFCVTANAAAGNRHRYRGARFIFRK